MMNQEYGYKAIGETTRKAMASKSVEKEIPHYRRASTGSCHDICKYGKKQISMEKPWRSTTKKIFKKALDDDLKETLKPGSSKTKKVMEVKKKKVNDDSSEVIKREVVKCQVSGGVKKQEALITSSGDETPVKQMKKKLTSCSKLKPSPGWGSRSTGNFDATKPKVLTKSYSALASSKSRVNHEQLASPVLKPKMGRNNGGKDEDTKIKKATASSGVVLKNVPVTPRSSLSPSIRLAGNSNLRKCQSLKAASSSSCRQIQKPRRMNLKDESNKQSDCYPVEEKTLHVVESETTKKVSEDDQNQECFVEPFPPLPPTQLTQNDSETEDYEYHSGSNEVESVKEEIGISKKSSGRTEGDSPDEAAKKLQFRRGKVVDADTVGESARKVKFRRGRSLKEDETQDAQGRRRFKKREDIREEEEEEEEEEEDEDGDKVVLRHQDVQEKVAGGLLNNVIEETASKLVEARKSKVKALVGAFETVISLQ